MNNSLILEKQDLTYLTWSKIRHSSGTAGSFLKAYSELSGKKIYYKLSNYDTAKGVIGHESVNELIVDRLLTLLGIEHLSYRLIHADINVNEKSEETYVCASDDFKQKGEDKTALDAYYDAEHLQGETPFEFCIRMGWEKYVYEMFVVDFLILNRDRHGANIEVLRNKKKKTIRLAPLFDHGLSLLCSCLTSESIDNFDVMQDRMVQSYLASRSAKDNLEMIPTDSLPHLNALKDTDKLFLMEGLDGVISKQLQDKIWDMIWERWCYYEDFCNKRRV